MADAKIVQITDQQGNELAPQTLISWVVDSDGRVLENLMLAKNNITEYTPIENYNPATKQYVDTRPRTKIITSIQQPTNLSTGDMWYQVPAKPYTFTQVDELNYTFSNIDALGLTWNEVDMGGW